MLPTFARGCLCTNEAHSFPPCLRMYLPFIGATKGYVATRLKAVIFYLNCGNRDRPYFRGLEWIVISDSYALSTNYA